MTLVEPLDILSSYFSTFPLSSSNQKHYKNPLPKSSTQVKNLDLYSYSLIYGHPYSLFVRVIHLYDLTYGTDSGLQILHYIQQQTFSTRKIKGLSVFHVWYGFCFNDLWLLIATVSNNFHFMYVNRCLNILVKADNH